MPELDQDPIVIEARISVTLAERSLDRQQLDHDARFTRAKNAVNSTLTAVMARGNIAGPREDLEAWSLNFRGDEPPADHELQEMAAADLNELAENASMMDGLVELLDQDTIDAFMEAVERVRLSREHEASMRP